MQIESFLASKVARPCEPDTTRAFRTSPAVKQQDGKKDSTQRLHISECHKRLVDLSSYDYSTSSGNKGEEQQRQK